MQSRMEAWFDWSGLVNLAKTQRSICLRWLSSYGETKHYKHWQIAVSTPVCEVSRVRSCGAAWHQN